MMELIELFSVVKMVSRLQSNYVLLARRTPEAVGSILLLLADNLQDSSLSLLSSEERTDSGGDFDELELVL